MSARNRASQRDFNRRRNLILTKAFDMVFYQRGTNLSKCLMKQNPREIEDSKIKLEKLSRKERSVSSNSYLKEKLFIENRWKTSIEPSILMQRPVIPYSTNFSNIPRYRRPTTATTPREQVIDTFVLARPCMRNKFNIWESTESIKKEPSIKERSVHFEPAISKGGALSKSDQKDLFEYWYTRRVSSGRDDATRQSMLKMSAEPVNRVPNIDTSTTRFSQSPSIIPEVPRIKSAVSNNSDNNVFITQINTNEILQTISDTQVIGYN